MTPPPLAVRVMVWVPTVALEATVKVVAAVPSPGTAKEDLLKDAVTPLGRPDQDRETAELKMP